MSHDNHHKKEKKRIDTLILSDIHLGDHGTRCHEILKVLRRYKFRRLILNGDILDGLSLERLHTDHWNILSKLRKLTRSREVVWVHGNHDARARIISSLLGVKVYNKYVWESGSKKFLAIHGHQYDRFLNNNYFLSRLAFALYSFLKYIDPSGRLNRFIKMHSKTWQRSSRQVARGCLRLARIIKADYVFGGHIHKIRETEDRGIKYFNTGSWVEKPSGYITITNGMPKLKRVD